MADAPPRYRFLRVLEYVGTLERVNEARERRAVKGTAHFGPNLAIFEGILGDAASPVVGQMRLKVCQMIVAADEAPANKESAEYHRGWTEACQEMLALIDLKPDTEPANG